MNPIRLPPFSRLRCASSRRPPDHMKLIVGLLVVAVVAVASGCAKTDWIDRTLVTVDVTGVWERAGSSTIRLELKQQGPNVTGYLRLYGHAGTPSSGDLAGSVAGDTFRFRQVNGPAEGEMTVSGDEMAGQIRGLPILSQVTLTRVNPSAKSDSPPR